MKTFDALLFCLCHLAYIILAAADGGLRGSRATSQDEKRNKNPNAVRGELLKRKLNIIGADDRAVVPNILEAPWKAVGLAQRLQSERHCTAVMVGRDLILTAQQCIDFGPDGSWNGDLEFMPAIDDHDSDGSVSTPFGVVNATEVYWDHKAGNETGADFAFNYVVARLDQYIGDLVGYWEVITYDRQWDGVDQFHLIGYDTGRPHLTQNPSSIQSATSYFSSTGAEAYIMRTTLDYIGGMTGGPVFGFFGSDQPQIVGIMSMEYTDGTANAAVGGPAMTSLIQNLRSSSGTTHSTLPIGSGSETSTTGPSSLPFPWTRSTLPSSQTSTLSTEKSGNIIGIDDRVDHTNSHLHPWTAVGLVQSETKWCTGVMVGPDALLTSQYCLHRNADGTLGYLKFTPAYNDGVAPHGTAMAEHVYWDMEVTGTDEQSLAFKYFVAKLDQPIGNTVGYWPVFAYNSTLNGLEVFSHIGYDLHNQIITNILDSIDTVATYYNAEGTQAYLMTTSIDFGSGIQTGGPVFAYHPEELGPTPVVIGILVATAMTEGHNLVAGGPGMVALVEKHKSTSTMTQSTTPNTRSGTETPATGPATMPGLQSTTTAPKVGNLFGTDDRVDHASAHVQPWTAVGIAHTETRACTGVMVAPKLVLTSQLCNPRNADGSLGYLKFIPAYDDGVAPYGTATAQDIYKDHETPVNATSRRDLAFDYMIATLDQPIGDTAGFWPVAAYNISFNGIEVWSHIGYEYDGEMNQIITNVVDSIDSVQAYYSSGGKQAYLMATSIDFGSGHQTGGPVYAYHPQELPTPVVVGILVAWNDTHSFVAGGPALKGMVDNLRAQFE